MFTVCLCFIFTKSVRGYSGYVSIDICRCDRSIDRSHPVIDTRGGGGGLTDYRPPVNSSEFLIIIKKT